MQLAGLGCQRPEQFQNIRTFSISRRAAHFKRGALECWGWAVIPSREGNSSTLRRPWATSRRSNILASVSAYGRIGERCGMAHTSSARATLTGNVRISTSHATELRHARG